MTDRRESEFAFAWQILIATAVVVSVLLVLLFVWYASNLLMLVFAGILVSILLRRFRRFLQKLTGLGEGLSLTIVTLVLFGIAGLVAWLVADRITSEVTALVSRLESAIRTVPARLEGYEWAQELITRLPSMGEMLLGRGGVLSQLPGFASTTFSVAVNALIVIVVGIYVASQTRLYSRGIKHLLPFRARARAAEVLSALDEALGRWLLGRFCLMVVNGVLTAGALWLLGVPLAPTLGLIAGLLNFIPNFGPFIAAIPAILIAFAQSPQSALYTAMVYLAVQMIDGYILTPLVDRRSVSLPPVVTIVAQLLLGVMFGFVGLLVASPLTAAAMIVIKMLYVEDVLGDRQVREGDT